MNTRRIFLWGLPVLVIGLAIACLISALAFQGARQRGWTTYTTDNSGLPDDDVRVIAFDEQGRAWIGTRDGVSTFAGKYWATYDLDYIHAIAFDEQGRAWIGTESAVHVFGETRSTYSARDSGLIADRIYIEGIVVDEQGRAWIGITYYRNDYQYSLSAFDGETWTNYTADDAGLTGGSINAVALDDQCRIWIGVNYYRPYNYYHHSVKVFDGETWITYSADDSGLADGFINTIAFDEQGRAWVGTEHGVSVFDWETWTTYAEGNVKTIAFDKQNRVWIGTERGVRVFDGRTWSTYTVGNSGLVDSDVRAIALDKQEHVWIGTGSGVSVFSPDEAVFVPQSLVTLRDCSYGSLCFSPVVLIFLIGVWFVVLFVRSRPKAAQRRIRADWKFWLRWTLANTLMFVVSYLVTFVVFLLIFATSLATGVGSAWVLLAIWVGPGVAGGLAGGTVGGIMQWLILRRHTPRAGWWVSTGTAGFVLCYTATLVPTILVFTLIASTSLAFGSLMILPAVIYSTVAGGVLGAAAGIVGGVVSGIVQWLILRQHVSQSGWWVPASGVGLAVGLITLGIGTPAALVCAIALLDPAYAFSFNKSLIGLIVGLLVVAAGGAMGGAIMGGALSRLLRHPPEGKAGPGASEQVLDNLEDEPATAIIGGHSAGG
jgi:hypothetical protein